MDDKNIVTDSAIVKVDLDILAAHIRTAHEAIGLALSNALDHAFAAGEALLEAQAQVKYGAWRSWLHNNCAVSERTARLYMALARHRAEIEAERQRVAELTLRGALKLIAKPGATSESTKSAPALTLAWSAATPDQRTRFLGTVGLPAVLAAIPPSWHAEIRQRVLGQERVKTRAGSKSNDTIVKALRQALSLQKTAKNRNEPAAGVAAAPNSINNLLLKDGADLNDIVGIEVGRTVKTATGKAA
jgi:hypothetical protein